MYQAIELKNEFRGLMSKLEEKRPYTKPRFERSDIECDGNW